MLSSTQHYLVITALGSDRSGIVNTITRHVSHCGCNIEDSRLALLGEEFTFVMLLAGDSQAISLIESTLPLIGAELDLLIVMKRTSAPLTVQRNEGIWLEVELPDSPRIIERFTHLLDQYQLNLAELITRTQPATTQQQAMLAICIKAHGVMAGEQLQFEAAFYQLCTKLNASGRLRQYGLQENES